MALHRLDKQISVTLSVATWIRILAQAFQGFTFAAKDNSKETKLTDKELAGEYKALLKFASQVLTNQEKKSKIKRG